MMMTQNGHRAESLSRWQLARANRWIVASARRRSRSMLHHPTPELTAGLPQNKDTQAHAHGHSHTRKKARSGAHRSLSSCIHIIRCCISCSRIACSPSSCSCRRTSLSVSAWAWARASFSFAVQAPHRAMQVQFAARRGPTTCGGAQSDVPRQHRMASARVGAPAAGAGCPFGAAHTSVTLRTTRDLARLFICLPPASVGR